MPAGTPLRMLIAAWDDGFDVFAEVAGGNVRAAAALACHLRLVPTTWRLTDRQLASLAVERSTPATELARRWGVSRWTITAWRRQLGLERRPK
ncbi:MAG: hypothetical protein ACT4PW_06045 [Acidimicrobiia bacterium]